MSDSKWREHQQKYSDIVALCNCTECQITGKKKGLVFVERYGWFTPEEIESFNFGEDK